MATTEEVDADDPPLRPLRDAGVARAPDDAADASHHRALILDGFAPGPSDALLVIDVQCDFCAGGALEVPGGDDVVPLCNALIRAFKRDRVVYSQDWHPPAHSSFASAHPGRAPFETIDAPYGAQTLWPDHSVRGTRGASFHPKLIVDWGEESEESGLGPWVVRKGFRPSVDSYSAFYENDRSTSTGLAEHLKSIGVRRVFVCGLALDYCVRYTALDARTAGFATVLVRDATRAVGAGDPGTRAEATETTTRELEDAGVVVVDGGALGGV
jgi:nicotinamidase/pyrazinamidase